MTILLSLFNILSALYFCFYLSLFITDYSFLLLPLAEKLGFSVSSISNISGLTLGLLLILTLYYIFNRGKFVNNPIFNKLIETVRCHDKLVLFFACLILFVLQITVSIARHMSLSSGASDLGIFDQAIWNASRGNMLFSSLMGNMDLLGYHFYPILLLFVPLYKIYSSPVTLLVVQSFLLSSAMIPLYLIAKNRLKDNVLVFAIVISYLLSRPLRGISFSDFHTECFILPLLFWIYYFLIIKKRNILLFTSVILLLISKEDSSFLLCGFGFFILFFHKRFKLGAILVASGLLIWFITTKGIIPHFNPQHNYPYMNRFPFGTTYSENLKTVIYNPILVARFFLHKEKIEYIIKLFGPLGFMPIFSPPHYILIAIPLFKNLLAGYNFSGFFNISSHYTAGIIPFVYIAAIYGSGWLVVKLKRKAAVFFVAGFIVLCSLMFYGKTDAHQFSRFLSGIKNNHTLEKLSYLKRVPKDASVATNFNLVPHMSQRKYIFEWNPNSPSSYITEYIVIDMNLLGYLSKEDVDKIGPYFRHIAGAGYKKIFESKDSTFLIFHNLRN